MTQSLPYAEVWVEFSRAEDGGRAGPVWLNDQRYRPHFRIGGGEHLGVEFVGGPDKPLPPGGSSFATVRLSYAPAVDYGALATGAHFEILEGATVVGRGYVVRR